MITALFALFLLAQPAQAAPEIDAQVVASAIQPQLPQRFSPDMAMVGAAAIGDLLVLTFEIDDATLAAATPQTLSSRYAFGFCSAPGGTELLAGPMSLRIDARTPSGRTLQGAVLETCPGAPARG